MYHDPDVPVILEPAHQQNASGSRSKVHGAQATLGAVGALGFVQVPHQDDGAAGLIGHLGQAFHHRAHLVSPIHVHLLPQVSLQGVEDHQLGLGVPDGLPNAVIQHGEREIRLVNGVNLLHVCLGFQQPGLDGVSQTVLGSLVENGKGFLIFPAGEGQSPAAGRRDPQGQSGLALGWVAVNDGQFPQGDVRIPEPAHRLHRHILQGDELKFWLIFWQITSHFFHRSQGKGGSSIFKSEKPNPFRIRPLLVLFFGWC